MKKSFTYNFPVPCYATVGKIDYTFVNGQSYFLPEEDSLVKALIAQKILVVNIIKVKK